MTTLIIHTDGGARGNPGPAGIGIVIRQRDKETNRPIEISEFIGEATNNQAEYKAVIAALKWVQGNIQDKNITIDFYLDSQLVVEQLNGNYKLKNEGLKPLFSEIQNLISEKNIRASFFYIPREKNREADRLVNKAIDEYLKK